MTQSLSDQKRKAAAIERSKEVIGDGVHALHFQVANRDKTGK